MFEQLTEADFEAARKAGRSNLGGSDAVPPTQAATATGTRTLAVPEHDLADDRGPERPAPDPDPDPEPTATATRPVALSPALTYRTDAGRLLAEGWTGADDIDGLRLVIRQIEVLRTATATLSAVSGRRRLLGTSEGIANAIYNADADAIVEAVQALGTQRWLDANLGNDTADLYTWQWQLVSRLWELVHANQRRLEASLNGWDTPAANAFRAFVRSFAGHVRTPKPQVTNAILYP